MRKLLLTHPSGSSAELYLNGAQVTSWIPASGGQRLYLSPRAVFEPGKPIRGGIPVVFPQFADSGPLPKHGWLRTTEWQIQSHEGASAVTLRTEESPESRLMWPHTYEVSLMVSLGEESLDQVLTVRNPGADAFSFTCALHSYFAVENLTRASVLGLYGLPYLDKTADRAMLHDSEHALMIRGPTDRIYTGSSSLIELVGGCSPLRISTNGFSDVVVWNPWKEMAAGIIDMEDDDYLEFVCIEAAVADRPVLLKPGEIWRGTQRLEATR
jgi:glucose-6-phosphate 1-epimerase